MSAFEFPLLKLELKQLLRQRRSFWLLIGVVALSGVIPLLTLSRWGEPAYISREAYFVFIYTQLIVVLLVVPAVTAGAIAGERERGTFDLLYTTHVTPRELTLSKVFVALQYVLLLIVAPLPVTSTLYLIGGIEFEGILITYGITIAAAASSTVVCLTVSMRAQRTAQAALRCVLWTVFWNLVLMGLSMLIAVLIFRMQGDTRADPGNNPVHGTIVSLSPFFVLGDSLRSMRISTPFALAPWQIYLIYATAVAIGHTVYLLTRTDKAAIEGVASKKRATDKKSLRKTRSMLTRALLNQPLNPVFTKEIQTESYGSRRYRSLLFFGSLLLMLLSYIAAEGDDDLLTGIGISAIVVLALLVPAIGATCFSREREQGNFDLFRGTLLSSHSLFLGKLQGVLYGATPILFAVLIFVGLAGLQHTEKFSRIIIALVVVLPLSTLFFATLIMPVAVVAKKSGTALVMSLLLMAAYLIGLPLLIAVGGPSDESAFFAISPFAALVGVLEIHWNRNSVSEVLFPFVMMTTLGILAAYGLAYQLARTQLSPDDSPMAYETEDMLSDDGL